MPVPKTPVQLSETGQKSVIAFYKAAVGLTNQQWRIRDSLLMIDRDYMRENDYTKAQLRARIANAYGDKTKMQNFTVPVVQPQVEQAVTYYSEVFLTGTPIFGVVAGKENMDRAMQMDTLMLNHQQHGAWVREFQMFFRDGFKYNLQAMEADWCEEKVFTPDTDIGAKAPKEVIWAGNRLKRLDLYNSFFDSRVSPALIATEGEFAGYVDLYSRTRLKKLMNRLPGITSQTMRAALDSGAGMQAYDQFYIPQINPYALLSNDQLQSFDWFSWAGVEVHNSIRYNAMYEVGKFYARIAPADFGILNVPQPRQLQIWKFYVVNGSVVIYAERQTNAHDMLPVIFGQPLEDGLDYQTKSLAQNVTGIQDLASAMINATIEGKRRAVMDRLLYDPSRIREADINSKNVVARIPVKPNAYGKPLSEAVYPFPYNDQQQIGLMQEAREFIQFGNLITGSNGVTQGQFQKGNKTRTEFVDTMSYSNGRNKNMALFTEDQVMNPLKHILKYNILQYQEAGTFYNPVQQKEVSVNPVDLRTQALEFKISDGMQPADKLISTEEMQVALQIIGADPQLRAEYDVIGMFTYVMEARGAKELKQFRRTTEEQTAYINQQAAITAANNPQPPTAVPPA